MELVLTPDEQAFRDEVRDFLESAVTDEIRRKTMTGYRLSREEHVAWQKQLYERGWFSRTAAGHGRGRLHYCR